MSNSDNRHSPRKGGSMGHGGMRPPEKAKNFKESIKKIGGYLSEYRFRIILVVIFAIGSTIFSIIGPKILGQATTMIFEGLIEKISGTGSIDFIGLGAIIMNLLVLYVLSTLFSLIQGFIMTDISQKVIYRLRRELSEKIHRMPMNYFESKTHGEVLSRFTNDVDTLSSSLSQSITQAITSIVTLVGVFVMMVSISGIMTVAAILTLPVSLILIMFIVKKSQGYFVSQQEYLGKVNGQVEEIFGGHNIVKVFNGEEEAIRTFDEANDSLYNSAWKSQFFSGLMMPIMGFVGNLGYVVVSILGGYLAIKRTIKVGDIQSFIQYVRSFNQPISQIAQISNQFQSMAAAAERVFEFLEEEEEDQTSPNPISIQGLEGSVTFDKIKFGYQPDKMIIHNFEAHINPGQKVAIVGPTGAGKTTIIKLLMRFYDVNEGSIRIDGHNIKDFNRNELRDMFGMVLQDTWLFHGTIEENIRYGRLDASKEEVIQAAKAAHAHHFIQTLPGGYNMVLNEEANNVSQGQKQLLTIARAILAAPKILILDEATSSVDTRTEIRIQKAMDNLMRGRTSFIIAHRLSTIRDADLILAMKDGDIVEQGNHEELLEAKGFYEKLYNSQWEKIS